MSDRIKGVLVGTAAVAVLAFGAVPAAHSGSIADFYRGKTITLYVGAGAGGGYGLYARLVAEHFGKHLPGTPTIVASFMPGSGGLKAANYIYNAARQDGVALGVLISPVAVQQFVRPEAAKFDVNRLQWIGVVAPVVQSFTVMRSAPATTIDGMKEKEIIAGATGVGSDTYVVPRLVNYALGTRIKIVKGYKGTADIALAMERGEVHAWAGPWTSKEARFPQLLDPGNAVQLFQFGLKRQPGYEDTPLLTDLISDPEKKRVVEFLSGPTALGRSVVAPPKAPSERVSALRDAFDAMVKDEAFLADARKRQAEVSPAGGDEIQGLLRRITDVSPQVVEEAKRILLSN